MSRSFSSLVLDSDHRRSDAECRSSGCHAWIARSQRGLHSSRLLPRRPERLEQRDHDRSGRHPSLCHRLWLQSSGQWVDVVVRLSVARSGERSNSELVDSFRSGRFSDAHRWFDHVESLSPPLLSEKKEEEHRSVTRRSSLVRWRGESRPGRHRRVGQAKNVRRLRFEGRRRPATDRIGVQRRDGVQSAVRSHWFDVRRRSFALSNLF